MKLAFVGATFSVIGEVIIGIAVLLVHKHVMREHAIDDDVLKEMKREQVLGMFGILFVIIGYIISNL